MTNVRRTIIASVLLAVLLLLTPACRSTAVSTGSNSSVAGNEIQVSGRDIDASEPAIAADADGSVYVVYVEHQDEANADVVLQKFGHDLTAVGPPVRIDPIKGTAKAWRGDPPTVAAANGTVYVGWTRVAGVDPQQGSDLMLSVSRDGGRSFADPVRVNDDLRPASHGLHSLAIEADGHVYMAWLDERNAAPPLQTAQLRGDTQYSVRPSDEAQSIKIHHNEQKADEPAKHEMDAAEPNSEVFFAVSNDGGRTFSPNKKVASDVCPCCKTSMLAADDGTLYLSWRQVLPGDFRHIAVASTKDKGATFSERTIVSDDKWKIHACPVSGPAMATGSGHSLNIFWYTAGEAGPAGLFKATSTDGGRTFGARQAVSTDGTVSGTPVAFNGQAACLFALNGDRITTGGITIENASLPAAVMYDGSGFAAFVRTSGEKHAVWIAPIH